MLHPWIASTPCCYQRLIRAHYWSVQDAPRNHAAYWRAQVAICTDDLREFIYTDYAQRHKRIDPDVEFQHALKACLRTAYDMQRQHPYVSCYPYIPQ